MNIFEFERTLRYRPLNGKQTIGVLISMAVAYAVKYILKSKFPNIKQETLNVIMYGIMMVGAFLSVVVFKL